MKPLNIIVCFLLFLGVSYAQTTEIAGTVTGGEGVDGIHIVNKSRKEYATTNSSGEFKINAVVKDTLVISSIQYKLETLIITEQNINTKTLTITLETLINELDEVTVGKVLTGNLLDDMDNLGVKRDINFYDVGIPGYKGVRKTKSERLLHEAGEFKPKMLWGVLMGGLPLNPIINGISGRTKELKQRVKLEAQEELMYTIKSKLSKDFFNNNPLEDNLKMEFFYFCSEDEKFTERCSKSDIETLAYLEEKYKQYQANRKVKE
ncbi:carboxypeptidase-like regulatory domain-containing protein [Pontimicrobium sp. MEBiC01747]